MQQLSTEEQERICRVYHIEYKSMRTIGKEFKHSRMTVAKVLADEIKKLLQATRNRQTPVFDPHQSRVEELLSLMSRFGAQRSLAKLCIWKSREEQASSISQEWT